MKDRLQAKGMLQIVNRRHWYIIGALAEIIASVDQNGV
jgi:hypothetical protein